VWPGAPDDRALILLHGYPAEKADLLPIAAAFHPDFTTLLVDLRYFGQSEGRATTLGHRERFDLGRAIDALAARGFTRIGVFGYSLGGAVAILGAAEDPRIRAVAAYAPFSDLAVLAGEVYAVFWLAKHPLVALMRLWSRVFLGADITRPSPASAAARLSIPVMLVHSRDDEQIPFAHAERLAAALRDNPRVDLHFGRGLHNDRAPDFERRLTAFFVKHLD
jgi:dipeptidyl aminopeptidase/acylaminoacyl peptidase